MRKFIAALVGVTVLFPALPASATPLQPRPLPQVEQAYPNESYAQYTGAAIVPIIVNGTTIAVTMVLPWRQALPAWRLAL